MKIMTALLLSASLLTISAFANTELPTCEHCDTQSQIDVFNVIAKQLELTPTDFEHRDLLESEEQRYYTLLTEPKRTYYLVAVCDSDCSDVDVGVWSADEERIEVDYELDAHPVVRFTAKESSYRVRVDLEDCKSSTCFTHVKAYTK